MSNTKATNAVRILWLGYESAFAVSVFATDDFEFVEAGSFLVIGIVVSSLKVIILHALKFRRAIEKPRRLDETRINYAAAQCIGFQLIFNSCSPAKHI